MPLTKEDEKKFQALLDRAHAAGEKAMSEFEIKPYMLTIPYDPMFNKKYAGYPRKGKACVRVTPGTILFSRWLKQEGYAYSSGVRSGGVIIDITITDEYDFVMAYAEAFAKVLRRNKIMANSECRTTGVYGNE